MMKELIGEFKLTISDWESLKPYEKEMIELMKRIAKALEALNNELE